MSNGRIGAMVVMVLGACLASAKPAAAADRAERLWRANCAACHGRDGKADTEKGRDMKIVDLTSASFQSRTTDARLRAAIHDGIDETRDGVKKRMDAFGDKLSAEDIDALAGFVRRFAPVGVEAPKAEAAPPAVTVAVAKAAPAPEPKVAAPSANQPATVVDYSAKKHTLTVTLPVAKSVSAKSLRRGAKVRLVFDDTGTVVGAEPASPK